MKHLKSLYILILISYAAFSANVFASDTPWQLPQFNGLVSGAITQERLPYEQVSTDYHPSLLIFGRLGKVFIEGNRAGTVIKRFGFGSLSALGQFRTHQFLDADNTNLTTKTREKSIEAGLQFSKPLGKGFVSQFSLLQDISSTHKGQEYEAAIYKRFFYKDLRIISTLALQYQSEALTDYYFGTQNYSAKADLTKEIELLAVYDINESWSAVAMWRYYKHGKQIEESPLTKSDFTERVALGVGYQF
jgi:outer membrane scaffolding protein for murein synthesis (MipA/OmpV family)